MTPIYEHVVLKGENLGQIAGRYGVRRKELLSLNDFSNPNLIRPGQSVRVCPQIPPRQRIHIVHQVAPGENLLNIAEQYGLTLQELVAFQHGGVADPNRIRAGQELNLWHDGEILPDFRPEPPPREEMREGVQLPASLHYHVKHPRLAYGTRRTIALIQQAVGRYVRRTQRRHRITIGDISRRGGGPIPPHVSHQNGRDVDVGYVVRNARDSAKRRSRVDLLEHIDVQDTWLLIKSFLDTESVQYIFVDHRIQRVLHEHAARSGVSTELLDELFQYPRNRHRAHGIIRHWPGHDDHFHVRFR